jgi:hypothetical protein
MRTAKSRITIEMERFVDAAIHSGDAKFPRLRFGLVWRAFLAAAR